MLALTLFTLAAAAEEPTAAPAPATSIISTKERSYDFKAVDPNDEAAFTSCLAGEAPPSGATTCGYFEEDLARCVEFGQFAHCCPKNCRYELVCDSPYEPAFSNGSADSLLTDCLELTYHPSFWTFGFGSWKRESYSDCTKLSASEYPELEASICCARDESLTSTYKCGSSPAPSPTPATVDPSKAKNGEACTKASDCQAGAKCTEKKCVDKPTTSASSSLTAGLAMLSILALL